MALKGILALLRAKDDDHGPVFDSLSMAHKKLINDPLKVADELVEGLVDQFADKRQLRVTGNQ